MIPLVYSLSEHELMATLRAIVESQARSRIVVEGPLYLHAEFRSYVLGFVDDVEFFIDPDEKELHFRSASRKGYSDLGVNRRRMEKISNELTQNSGIDMKTGSR